jgi:hypothetical protein
VNLNGKSEKDEILYNYNGKNQFLPLNEVDCYYGIIK